MPHARVSHPGRYVELPIALGEALHEAIIEFFDAELGSRVQCFAGVNDLVDLLQPWRRRAVLKAGDVIKATAIPAPIAMAYGGQSSFMRGHDSRARSIGRQAAA